MKPDSDIYCPIHPSTVDLLKWAMKEKPELNQQVLEGVEIGFQRLNEEYRKKNS